VFSPPIRSLWLCAWGAYGSTLLAGVLLLFGLLFLFGLETHWSYLLLAILIIDAIVTTVRQRWLWKLALHIRDFRTAVDANLTLHLDPTIDYEAVPNVISYCNWERSRLDEWFRPKSRRRLVVFLLAHQKDIERILGFPVGGYALVRASAVLIAIDNNPLELIPHEFTHLSSMRCNESAPAILSEGLAVWLQLTWNGDLINVAARKAIDPNTTLSQFMDHRFFFSKAQRDRCYLLSGSFVGFLIDRFGWTRFWEFYRVSGWFRFQTKWERHFGMTFEEAERQWRMRLTSGCRSVANDRS